MDQSIIAECFIDTNLLETLVPPITQYNHKKGCGTVTKVMKERFTDRFALGIIDKDKYKVDYLKEFEEVCSSGSLILHKHRNRHHYIIQINPAMERFILNSADAAGISLHDFGLPVNIDLLKKESKTVVSKKDERFKKLFKSLREKHSPDIIKLSGWIHYLKERNYNADMSLLKQL